MADPAGAGFFGKLPSAGDFVQRRLPQVFVDVWDRNFERAVADSRERLGTDWVDVFEYSPLWRFVLNPGVCGRSAWAGVLGPGADRVGRRFPMVIAVPLGAGNASAAQVLTAGGRWFEAAEALHRNAQADGSISVDAFDAGVAALPDPRDVMDADLVGFGSGLNQPPSAVDWNASTCWRLPLPGAAEEVSTLHGLWTQSVLAGGHRCLWWTRGAERVPASVLVTEGLPQSSSYAAFLDAACATAPAWQSIGEFIAVDQSGGRTAPEYADASAAVVSVPVATLPDDLSDLLGDSIGDQQAGFVPDAVIDYAAPQSAVAKPTPGTATGAVLELPGTGLTVIAVQCGEPDSRQQAAAAVFRVAADLAAVGHDIPIQTLRAGMLGLNPQLARSREDLVNPVPEDCAVVAVRRGTGQAELLRIGSAAAWLWSQNRLKSMFIGKPATAGGDSGEFNDLLFGLDQTAASGLGAAEPSWEEVSCAIAAGDRLLLLATTRLVQLSPEILARALAMPSCEVARARIAGAAGLDSEAAAWPIIVIEIGS